MVTHEDLKSIQNYADWMLTCAQNIRILQVNLIYQVHEQETRLAKEASRSWTQLNLMHKQLTELIEEKRHEVGHDWNEEHL